MIRKINIAMIILVLTSIYCSSLFAADSVFKWDAVGGDVYGYKIYYGNSSGVYSFSEDVGNVTQYAISNFNLTEGTTYYFVVRAYNNIGESSNSNEMVYVVPVGEDTTPPVSPQGVTASIENDSIKLNWTANNEADLSGYRVYYGTGNRDYGLPVFISGNEYTILSLDTGVTYYFAVTAVDTAGNASGYSSPEIAQSIPVSEDGVSLKWDPVSGIAGYKIYYSKEKDTYKDSIDVGNVTKYLIENFQLDENTTYYFVVRSYNDSGESANSNVAVYVNGDPEDNTKPLISIESPTTASVYNSSILDINIGGTASDDSEISKIVWTNSAGGSGAISGTTVWSINHIKLIEGENTITVTVSDTAGNQASDSIKITCTIPDLESPLVSITLPTSENSFETSNSTIDISGTAFDGVGVASVKWSSSAGGKGTAIGTKSWAVNGITLIEGDNIISINAIDAAGNTAIDTINVIYMPEPVSKLAWYAVEQTQDSKWKNSGVTYCVRLLIQKKYLQQSGNKISLLFKGRTTGNYTIRKVSIAQKDPLGREGDVVDSTWTKVLFNGKTEATWATDLVTISADSEKWSDLVPFVLDINKDYYVTFKIVTASVYLNPQEDYRELVFSDSSDHTEHIDWSGKGFWKARDYHALAGIHTEVGEIPDTQLPDIKIVLPTSGSNYSIDNQNLSISGTASDNVGVTQVSWSNSQGGNGIATGTDNWSIAQITLAEGENLITMMARDEAGNIFTDTLTVVYTIPDTTSPVVTILVPSSEPTGSSYYTKSNSISLSGTSSDDTGTSSVTWSNQSGGSGKATGTDNWNVAGITLSEGENVIILTAMDKSGNKSTDVLTVIYTKPVVIPPVERDIQAPVLKLKNPTSGRFYFTRKAAIKLSGTASDNIGVKRVKWEISQGGNGVTKGTTNWEAFNVPLARWWNNITLTAEDEAGNKTSHKLTVFSWR